MESRLADANNTQNSLMRTCVKQATQFQSAVTESKIFVYSHPDIIYGIQDHGPWTMVYVTFYDFFAYLQGGKVCKKHTHIQYSTRPYKHISHNKTEIR